MAGSAKRRKTAKRTPAATSRTVAKRPTTTRRTTKKPVGTAQRRPTTRKAATPAPPKAGRRAPGRKAPDDTVARVAAQLAVVESVQKALAGGLSLQGVYETVGDRVREVFHGANVGIRIYDPQTGLEHYPYSYYNDKKYSAIPSEPLGDKGFGAHVIRTRKTLVIDENLERQSDRYGSNMLVDDAPSPKTQVMVPLIVGDQARGMLVLADTKREHAFSKSDVRLLETLASSVSVALENARLFDETQRLLKETEQRNAELAIINSVQAALAAELDIQGIYDAVGDKIRDIFHNTDMSIRIYDAATNVVHYPYVYENGKRNAVKSHPLVEGILGARHPHARDARAQRGRPREPWRSTGATCSRGPSPKSRRSGCRW